MPTDTFSQNLHQIHLRSRELSSQGRVGEAEALYYQAIRFAAESYGFQHPNYAIALWYLGTYYQGMRRDEEAKALFLENLNIMRVAYPLGHMDTSTTLECLGNIYRSLDRSIAINYYLESLAMRRRLLPTGNVGFVGILNALALTYYLMDRYN